MKHWLCTNCGTVDGLRAGMACHGPGNTGICLALGETVVEISPGAVKRLRKAWEPGTLPTIELEQILADVLADLWSDAYRRDKTEGERSRQFRRTVETALYCATGREIWLREERG